MNISPNSYDLFGGVAMWSRMITLMAVLLFGILGGCNGTREQPPKLRDMTCDFAIHWPPVAPKSSAIDNRPPLLRGFVLVNETTLADDQSALEISVTITRPSSDEDREYWNSQLSFVDVPWMDDVRVWDSESKWQWPNLPFLLRRHGVERVERYGGIDPGKQVDNDFAAVLIRKFDASGQRESSETKASPFVSAAWSGDTDKSTDGHSVIHVAKTGTFVIPVGAPSGRSEGKLKLWLIYADFLGSRVPESWPKEREWSGGILAYCELDWQKTGDQPCRGRLQIMTPPSGTGFDWAQWSEDPSSPAKSKLTVSQV